MTKKLKVELMLDSGIFSAWNRKEEISINDYMAYVKDYKHLLHSYISMDKIPGEIGRKNTRAEVEESSKISYQNLQIMKENGLSPIPVFHQGEPIIWLERMLQDGEKYIAVSAGKDLAGADGERLKWLDTVFSVITDAKGRPLIKTHGMGITRTAYLTRYPFTTVDSTTWLLTPGFGIIIVPSYGANGKPDYMRPPVRIPVTGNEQKSSSQQKLQLEGLPDIQFEGVAKFLRDEVGCSIGQIRYSTSFRRKAVLIYFMRLAEHLKDVRFTEAGGGFVTKIKSMAGKPLPPQQLKVMFATAMMNTEWSQMLTDNNVWTRLVSYYETRNIKPEKFEKYVKDGLLKQYVKRIPRQLDWNETYRNHRHLKQLERLERLNKEYGEG
jgi:hypothetical protein